MASYQTFTSPRATEPDLPSLRAQLTAQDATAGLQHAPGTTQYVVKKTTLWTGAQVTAAQTVIDTSPTATDQLTAQAIIDTLSIVDKAQDLTILDEINILRAAVVPALPARTAAQAINAMRVKAGQL